jgi:hypothetical protein
MARPSPYKARLEELEERYSKALETIEQMSRNHAQMAAQIGQAHAYSNQYAPSGQLVVGIRNVSNYSIGITDNTTGVPMDHQLNPEREDVADPRTRAVISYVYWQQLRTAPQVARGMIVRDDSILGPADNAAPPDRPTDIHPDHAKNVVLDPREWIMSRTEEDVRRDIEAMTSEPSLRRLLFAVDQEIVRIGDQKYAGDPDRARKSIRDLPALFRVVEELAEERLDDLNPVSKVRHLETESFTARASARYR